MNKAELAWMLKELNEKTAVIRGYAQMTLECDHPNWSKKYINSIIQQIDKITALNTVVAALYLCGDDDNHDPGCKSTTLNNLILTGRYP